MSEQVQKAELVDRYAAGVEVLTMEAPFILGSIELLGKLARDSTDKSLIPFAATAATDPETPATSALDVLPAIQKAIEPVTPKQTDLSHAANVRWTMDWKAIAGELKARATQSPEITGRITGWFLNEGSKMVETRFAPAESRTPLYVVVGGANDSCNDRPALALASMATPEFRTAYGLNTLPDHSLNGENERSAGWLRDNDFLEMLRTHVRERVEAGEIDPRLLVAGSAAKGEGGRVLNDGELGKVSKYIGTAQPLYADRGYTEADAMLAGALHVFGGDKNTLVVEDIETHASDEPAKLIRFESALGFPVSFIATTGPDANLLRQSLIAYQSVPELFEGRDAMYGTTTAIYAPIHRAILHEVAALKGMSSIPVDVLGHGAHAAGIERNQATLVGELTQYLKAIYSLAYRMLESAELNTRLDIHLLGNTALHGSSDQ